MKLNKDLVLREVGGEYMIVNPFSDTVDMTQVYSLNETAAWLWQQMEGKEFTVADFIRRFSRNSLRLIECAAVKPSALGNSEHSLYSAHGARFIVHKIHI